MTATNRSEDEAARLAAAVGRARRRQDAEEGDRGDRADPAPPDAHLLLPLLSELRRIRLETRRLQDEVAEARSELRSWTGRFGRPG